jgi:hypothetical protein
LKPRAHVLGALAQGRDLDDDAREAPPEVFTKGPFAHGLAQVGVGAHDDAHVGTLGVLLVLGAEAMKLPLAVEKSEEQPLHLERQEADLVEKERASVRGVNGPAAVAVDARGGPFARAEELDAKERPVGGLLREVEMDEAASAAFGVDVEALGQSALADARLTLKNAPQTVTCGLEDHPVDRAHPR